jgi:hypothetical protein
MKDVEGIGRGLTELLFRHLSGGTEDHSRSLSRNSKPGPSEHEAQEASHAQELQ